MAEVAPQAECILCRALGALYGIGGGTYIAMHAPPAGLKRWGVLSVASGIFLYIAIYQGLKIRNFTHFVLGQSL